MRGFVAPLLPLHVCWRHGVLVAPAGAPRQASTAATWASASSSVITFAYLAFISKRLTRFENGDRSKQPSSTTNTVKLCEKASTTLARTQPDVLVPQTSSESTPSR